METTRGYLVCSIPRTGSGLLTQALRETGVAGLPYEYFNAKLPRKNRLAALLGDLSPMAAMDLIVRAGTSDNGIFGSKIHWQQLHTMAMHLPMSWESNEYPDAPGNYLKSLPEAADLDTTFVELWHRFSNHRWHREMIAFFQKSLPELQFIWLRRRDMLRRAISHVRARQSGVWHLPRNAARPSTASLSYEFSQIHLLHCIGVFEDRLWSAFFSDNGVMPLQVFYEDLVADYTGTMSSILHYLGLETHNQPLAPPLARQADHQSEEWRARYIARTVELGISSKPKLSAIS